MLIGLYGNVIFCDDILLAHRTWNKLVEGLGVNCVLWFRKCKVLLFNT